MKASEQRNAAPEDPQEVLARAARRGRELGLAYAGAVTPTEAHRLSESGAATIVDIRTLPEWQFVGHVPEAPLIEWPRTGEPSRLAAFVQQIRAHFEPDQPLLLICRSGVRSHYAAELLAQAGFPHAYNVLEGFEGDDGAGGNGWRAAGLPSVKGQGPQR